jgi:hypothetical protein
MGLLYSVEEALSLVLHTQGDSGRNVTIFCGVVTVVAGEKRSLYEHMSNCDWLLRWRL